MKKKTTHELLTVVLYFQGVYLNSRIASFGIHGGNQTKYTLCIYFEAE